MKHHNHCNFIPGGYKQARGRPKTTTTTTTTTTPTTTTTTQSLQCYTCKLQTSSRPAKRTEMAITQPSTNQLSSLNVIMIIRINIIMIIRIIIVVIIKPEIVDISVDGTTEHSGGQSD